MVSPHDVSIMYYYIDIFLLSFAWCCHLSLLNLLYPSPSQVITSQEKEITIKRPNGETTTATVRIWNETVSNLTLMALGSSAPEILLSVIEASTIWAGWLDIRLTGSKCDGRMVISFFTPHIGVWSWPPGWLFGPQHHCGQRCLQHVRHHRYLCLRGSWWWDAKNQTPPGVFRHGGLEYLCLHLALPNSECVFPRRGGGEDSWNIR